ncbi:MAG: LysM peptidoglycan-binding domain-containing protein [Phycisphaeraceae bacterium]
MTRETKLGLLIGTGIILLIGIVISDHLSVVHNQDAAMVVPPPANATGQTTGLLGSPSFPGVNDAGTLGGQEAWQGPMASDANASGNVGSSGAEPRHDQAAPTGNTPAGTPGDAQPAPNHELPLPDGRVADAFAHRIGDPLSAYNVQGAHTGGAATDNPAWAPNNTARDLSLFSDDLQIGQAQKITDTAHQTQNTQQDRLSPPDHDVAPLAGQIHYVKPGESLWDIAKTYYGDGGQWRMIADANKDKLAGGTDIRQGVRLVIPAKAQRSTVNPDAGGPRLSQGHAAPGKTVTVAAGDSLYALARKHLGDGNRWREILKTNSDKIQDAGDLKIGMVLSLPGSEPVLTGQTTPGNSQARGDSRESGAAGRTYTVQLGDSLYAIARKHMGNGNRWKDLQDANKATLKGRTELTVGQVLIIPTGSAGAGAARHGA